MTDVVIVGGGASGMAAAISAKRTVPSCSVVLLEAADRVGKKLLVTGNGRCNLTALQVTPERYHGDRAFARQTLSRFSNEDAMAFFRSLSLRLTEENGKVFPYSLQAASVVDTLRFACDEAGVETRCNAPVTDLVRQKNGFLLETELTDFAAKRVIWAVGSPAGTRYSAESLYAPLVSLGHRLTPLLPAIVQVRTNTDTIRPLKGIKVNADVSAFAADKLLRKESGEVLFAEYGISGPPVLQISRLVSSGECDRILLDLIPDCGEEELLSELLARLEACKAREDNEFLTGFLNKRLGQTLLRLASAKRTPEGMRTLARLIKNFPLTPRGVTGWQHAQVAAGGLDTRDFDPLTLASKRVAGLYATGEVLNVDGDCGGFNLQWAWSSGVLAGRHAARSLL